MPAIDKCHSIHLKNAVRLAWSIHHQQFSAFHPEIGIDTFIQPDKNLAIQQLLSDYQESSSVWYLTETHFQAYRLTQWLRPKLFLKTDVMHLEQGDWLEIYVWPANSPLDKISLSGSLDIVEQIGKLENCQQSLTGRKNPIYFHRLPCTLRGNETQFVLLEFLISEKPELHADIAVALNVWEKKNGEKNQSKKTAYVRYGYAATVHHAQGMQRNTVYLNCDHSANRHSEGFFRWLYSALTVAKNKTILLNFTPIHPFDQAIWKTQNLRKEEAEKIYIGSGWTWQNNQHLGILKDYISQVSESLGYLATQIATHPYQEHYHIKSSAEDFTLRISYNSKNQVTAFHSEQIKTYWSIVSIIAQSCINNAQYTDNARALLYFLTHHPNQCAWFVVSAVQENDYRLNITFVRAFDERINAEINFDKQGLVSSIRILMCSNLHLIDELKGWLT